jgi:hypothetical protein
MVTIFFTHVHVLQKAYMFFTTVIIFRKYDTAIDTSCAFETNDLNFTTANFDSYGNLSFDPCEFTLHPAVSIVGHFE